MRFWDAGREGVWDSMARKGRRSELRGKRDEVGMLLSPGWEAVTWKASGPARHVKKNNLGGDRPTSPETPSEN